MSRLWLLRGDREAPGWQVLRSDQQEDRVEMVHLDPRVWAIVRADEPPSGYEGVEAAADSVLTHFVYDRDNVLLEFVDDDGPGVPADQREAVFKPFFRLDASRNTGTGGVGLGLSIARDIVLSHGGDIQLHDAPTGGLRVLIRLPC